jgi:hypothetical protein
LAYVRDDLQKVRKALDESYSSHRLEIMMRDDDVRMLKMLACLGWASAGVFVGFLIAHSQGWW